jgi:hypothetical protein
MSDQDIAAIARRVAVSAALSGYERRPDSTKEFLAALTELCAAVRQEQTKDEQPAGE